MRSLAVGLVLALLMVPRSADAQASLINGLGGPAGYGTTCIGMNDDGSSNPIDITPYFPGGLHFFSMVHRSLYVNTNGNITFSDNLPTFTPDAFPVASRPMIAPFWADVDTRTIGSVETCIPFFGCTTMEGCQGPGDGEAVIGPACDNPSEDGIWWHLEAATSTTPARAIFTWDRVGYFQCHNDHRMSFQLILTQATGGCGGGATGGTDFDVEFRFNRCDWETGDASGGSGGFGGTPAQSGFDAGDRTNFVEIMGSRMNGIANKLCTMSNVSDPGVWRFFVRGGVVMCPDAGAACSTGLQGVCADGRTNCVGSGTECVQAVMPSPERCDNLDNDCNGTVDDGGDALCPAGQACQGGVCVDACFELGCSAGQVCTASGSCVDAGCETITCPEGQRCEGGACVGACDGVTCPHGLSCVAGSCVDTCAGLTCDDCTVCIDGACVARCPSRACAGSEVCESDGRCVEAACNGVTCPTGQYCSGGSCADACAGAVCPTDQSCVNGECINRPMVDAGVPDFADAGPILPGEDAGSIFGQDAGPSDVDAGRRHGPMSPGCACRASSAPHGSILWLAPLAFLVWRRRRA